MRRKQDLTLSLAELARRIGAEAPDPAVADLTVTGLSDLAEAAATELAFITGAKYMDKALASKAGAFLVPPGLCVEGRPCLTVADVWRSVFAILDIFNPDETTPAGIHPSAVVDPTAEIGANVSIGPLAVIEKGAQIGDNTEIGAQCFIGRNVVIGADSLLHPGVRVLERVEIGARVILHCGVVLGADGFGYKFMDGKIRKLPQVGTVILEDDVEVGANACIDRATFGETRIGAGTKIDNLVQVAHNCKIGPMCVLASQVGLSGSVRTGTGCIFWGQVGLADQLTVGNGVQVFAQSGVKDNIPDGAQFFGYPAGPMGEQARLLAAQKQLPDILKRLRSLEKKVK